MRPGAFKSFWLAFILTLSVLLPLVGVTLLLTGWQNKPENAAPAADSKRGVAVAVPDENDQLTLLICVADEKPAFLLLYLNAQENTFRLLAVPAESVLVNGDATPTLAESYAAAGPGRAAALLGGTLSCELPHYLALSPDTLCAVAKKLGTARVGLTGALTAPQLTAAGLSGEVREWNAADARDTLVKLDAQCAGGGLSAGLTPLDGGRVRAALWEGWLRQKLDTLPAALPDALRAASTSLLTNLSATDVYALGDTLEFLANQKAEVEAGVLPGDWNAAAGRYEFTDGTLAALNAFFSAEAASSQSAVSSAP